MRPGIEEPFYLLEGEFEAVREYPNFFLNLGHFELGFLLFSTKTAPADSLNGRRPKSVIPGTAAQRPCMHGTKVEKTHPP